VKPLAGLLSGLIFGFGLALSGMTDSNRVLGFLDIFGAWEPALLLVMGSAVAVTLIGFYFVLRQAKPVFAPSFYLPTLSRIDARLLSGAALFGIGWGIYGYCPGPAITALAYAKQDTVLFVGAMIAGMWLASRIPTGSANG
jgi:uncharacterized membrane protein YedE/YeeE